MATASTRLAVPIRQVLACSRVPVAHRCINRSQAYRWQGLAVNRAFSIRAAGKSHGRLSSTDLRVGVLTDLPDSAREEIHYRPRVDRTRCGREDWYYLRPCPASDSLTSSAGTIGITNYASNALGDVVYVELPEIGLEVNKGDSIGAVESVKSASDIMTPVSGKIVEANGLLEEKPGSINKGPEGEGWLAKIEVTDTSELDELMSKEGYDTFQKE